MFRRVSLIVVALSLLSGFAVPAAQDAANDKDKKLLQGKWQEVSLVEGGEESKVKSKKFVTFDGDKVKITQGDQGDDILAAGTFIVDAGKTPKTIDLKGKDGAPLDRRATGIYQLKGDDLKLCLGKKERPTEFVSTAKNGHVVIVYKRVKN